jgi:hypothetical protein
MVLNTRIHHYGFVLAMPATLVLVVALLDWLPAAIARSGGCGGVLRAAVLSGLATSILAFLSIRAFFVHSNSYPVGRAPDNFMADARGIWVDEALQELEKYNVPHEDLLVLPEGVMLNYLSRRPNPTPYIFFMPFDVNLFGEDRMQASFEAQPPTLIALVHKNTAEYGPRFFGTDYGVRLVQWIHRNYRAIRLFGEPPLQEKSRVGILLMRHKSLPP